MVNPEIGLTKYVSGYFISVPLCGLCPRNQMLSESVCFQRSICRKSGRDPALHDVEDVLVEISSFPALGPLVRNSLGEIVWRSSLRQTAQGILTAGPTKAIRYGFDKIKKKLSGGSEPPSARIIRPTLSPDEIYKLEMLKEKRRLEEGEIGKKEPHSTKRVPDSHRKGDSTGQLLGGGEVQVEGDQEHESHPPNLSDLDVPFGLKRRLQESPQPTHSKGFITFTVRGQEEALLQPKPNAKGASTIPNIPPILTHELMEPILKASNPNQPQQTTSQVEKGQGPTMRKTLPPSHQPTPTSPKAPRGTTT